MFSFYELISKINIDYSNKSNKRVQTTFINALKKRQSELNTKE